MIEGSNSFYYKKNVLVTGGAGFVGSNLIERLFKLGADITATLHNKAAVIQDNRITYLKCDLRNAGDCKQALQNIDYVFMCAANTSGAKVMAQPPCAFDTESAYEYEHAGGVL